jgi:tRNA pseudouridine38-40 synthase
VITRKDPFLREQAFFFPHPLMVDRMNAAAALLLKQEDFACFTKTGGNQNGTHCRVTHAQWLRLEDRLVFSITANRFLRNMVRAIVGTLLETGEGKCSTEQFEAILASGNRSDAGMSVPAHGLSLVRVEYPFITRSHG